jgi:SOS-response transcriptional repressor LexA
MFFIYVVLMQNIDILRLYRWKHQEIPSFSKSKELFRTEDETKVTSLFEERVSKWFLNKKKLQYIVTDRLIWIPLSQKISAWFDAPARDENRYEQLNLHTHLIERPNSTFLLEVSWDSMIEWWIKSWDTVIVDRSLLPRVDDVVVASIDGDFTLKWYSKDIQGKVCLIAGNKEMYPEPFYPTEEMCIIGVVVSSFRKYR